MPLESGSSKATISHNISEMVKAGHPQKQAVAASLHKARGDARDTLSPEARVKELYEQTNNTVDVKRWLRDRYGWSDDKITKHVRDDSERVVKDYGRDIKVIEDNGFAVMVGHRYYWKASEAKAHQDAKKWVEALDKGNPDVVAVHDKIIRGDADNAVVRKADRPKTPWAVQYRASIWYYKTEDEAKEAAKKFNGTERGDAVDLGSAVDSLIESANMLGKRVDAIRDDAEDLEPDEAGNKFFWRMRNRNTYKKTEREAIKEAEEYIEMMRGDFDAKPFKSASQDNARRLAHTAQAAQDAYRASRTQTNKNAWQRAEREAEAAGRIAMKELADLDKKSRGDADVSYRSSAHDLATFGEKLFKEGQSLINLRNATGRAGLDAAQAKIVEEAYKEAKKESRGDAGDDEIEQARLAWEKLKKEKGEFVPETSTAHRKYRKLKEAKERGDADDDRTFYIRLESKSGVKTEETVIAKSKDGAERVAKEKACKGRNLRPSDWIIVSISSRGDNVSPEEIASAVDSLIEGANKLGKRVDAIKSRVKHRGYYMVEQEDGSWHVDYNGLVTTLPKSEREAKEWLDKQIKTGRG